MQHTPSYLVSFIPLFSYIPLSDHTPSLDVGQGSSQALEDAEALSHFLAPLGATDAADGGPADIPELAAALAAFEAIRVPRAQLVQRAARALLGALPPQELPLAAAFTQELVLEYAGAEAELAKA